MKTPSLYDFLADDRALRAVYGDAAPGLEAVYLHQASLLLPERAVKLAVSFRDYPLEPPAKWRTQGFNRVNVALTFYDISHFESVWSGAFGPCGIDLSGRADQMRVRLRCSDQPLLSFASTALFAGRPTGYRVDVSAEERDLAGVSSGPNQP